MMRILLLTCAVLALAAGPSAADSWVRVAGGFSQMAMDDIDGATFNFYDEPGEDATFGDVKAGWVFDLGLGYDLSETWGLGLHWDHQRGSTSATDQGVDGELNLAANLFIARGYWRPLRKPTWNLGLMAGFGPIFSSGEAKISRGSTNYGEDKIEGNGWSLDLAAHLDWVLTDHAQLQVQGGWRSANIDKFKVGGYDVQKEDGSNAALDYSGWQVKVGVRWLFSENAD